MTTKLLGIAILCFGGLAAVSSLLALRGAPPAPVAADSSPPPPSGTNARLMGTASCSARNCHGGVGRTDEPIYRSAATIWLSRDPHADAGTVLTGERAQNMAARLGLGRAEQAERCLACHATPQALPAGTDSVRREELLSGVGCEACHGAAEHWYQPHTLPSWQGKSRTQKRAYGMFLATGAANDPDVGLAERARICAGCHVGAAAGAGASEPRDVNHDLIAAGHPRLNFELGVFQANMPKHWDEETFPGFEAVVWEVGQAASAEAALALLATRARTAHSPWPELAEYDCFACHHDLQGRPWRGEPTDVAGRLRWNSWYRALLPRALEGKDSSTGDLLARLSDALAAPVPDRRLIAEQARAAAASLREWPERLERTRHYDAAALHARYLQIATNDRTLAYRGWDQATQFCLALAAFDDAYRQSSSQNAARFQKQHEAVRGLEALLAFPSGYDSPKQQDSGAAFEKHLQDLLKKLGD